MRLKLIHRPFLWLLAFSLVICSCNSYKKAAGISKPVAIKEIKLLGEYIVPHNTSFKQTIVGGLSGIDYDAKRGHYYLVSDDWSFINPARFYTAKIQISPRGIDSVIFNDVTFFLQKNGTVYPKAAQNPLITPDPEALRYNVRQNNMIWTNEGERYISKDSIVLQDPSIRIINTNGLLLDSFPLPKQTHMYASEKGLRRNGVFEGMTFAESYKTLYVSIEEPLYEDGRRAGLGDTTAIIRILKYDVKKRQLLAQYAYQVDPVVTKPTPENAFSINGVADILAISNHELLFLERSFSTGKTHCNIRVYIGDVSNATNIADQPSLNGQPVETIKKRLLIDFNSLGKYIDNIEGVTFGPTLPNGHKTLLFVADNNFKKEEITQLLLFEILP